MRADVDGEKWAIVLAPDAEGWKVKYLPEGARLADGGGTALHIDEALQNIRELVQLLREDELTVQLFLTRPPDPRL